MHRAGIGITVTCPPDNPNHQLLVEAGVPTIPLQLRHNFNKADIATLRHELVDRTIIWNQRKLERLVIDYIDHYNQHRPHRSLDQQAVAIENIEDGVTRLFGQGSRGR